MELSSETATDYADQRFKRLTYRSKIFARQKFDACTFEHCSFQETVFQSCRFNDCTFTDCDLRLARVPGSSFRNVMFERSNVTGVNWADGSWAKSGLLNSIGFRDCDISYATFIGLDLKKLVLTHCVAKDVEFSDANLTQADCTETDFFESRFVHTNLTEADFTHARNYAIDPMLNTLKKAKFSLPEAIALLRSLNIELIE